MATRLKLCDSITLIAFLGLACGSALAQFTGSIQGTVQDPSNAAVATAKVILVSTATGVTATAVSDASGNYRFVSLAPGAYRVTVEATGFSKAQVEITLLTEQNLILRSKIRQWRSCPSSAATWSRW